MKSVCLNTMLLRKDKLAAGELEGAEGIVGALGAGVGDGIE